MKSRCILHLYDEFFYWLIISSRALISRFTALALVFQVCSAAGGIPEPGIVMYGIVFDAQGVRQTAGTLQVSLRPSAGGTTIQLTAQLADVNDQYSYILHIPLETEVAGFPVGEGIVKLTDTPTRYDRSIVTFNGVRILYNDNSLSSLDISPAQRGLFQRVDFSPTGASGDVDADGLLDSWEMQYFGNLNATATGDQDQDGMPNRAEMLAGTSPTDPASRFKFVMVGLSPTREPLIDWSSEAGKSYRVLRSQSVIGGYSVLAPNVAATPPVNRYRDTTVTSGGPYFYRIELITP